MRDTHQRLVLATIDFVLILIVLLLLGISPMISTGVAILSAGVTLVTLSWARSRPGGAESRAWWTFVAAGTLFVLLGFAFVTRGTASYTNLGIANLVIGPAMLFHGMRLRRASTAKNSPQQ